ncbi:MAG: leucine-rich repeat protein [Oscillospiraceae bacterium]|nr:leucine-rich repeat protein [Oscillospiraceae bacterium]
MDRLDPKAVWPGWKTVRLIGRGSFGAVYEIERDIFGEKEKAALKLITIPQNSSDLEQFRDEGYDDASITRALWENLKSILSEYSLMRKLNGSPNVVSCEDVRYLQHEDCLGWDILIKMELLTPLPKHLDKNVTEEQVLRVGMDICRALVLCRKHNIVHRDIKPANIFVSENGDCKLGDFGIAKTMERTSGGTKIGTYEYMAPEVYNNQPYGHSADVCSLGLVLYWMLNERRLPFLPLPPEMPTSTQKEQARDRRMRGEALPAPAHGSEELKCIVLRACASDPAERYSTAEELLDDLENLQISQRADKVSGGNSGARSDGGSGSGSGGTVIPVKLPGNWRERPGKTPPGGKKPKAPKRKRKLILGILAAAVLAAILLAVFLHEKESPTPSPAPTASLVTTPTPTPATATPTPATATPTPATATPPPATPTPTTAAAETPINKLRVLTGNGGTSPVVWLELQYFPTTTSTEGAYISSAQWYYASDSSPVTGRFKDRSEVYLVVEVSASPGYMFPDDATCFINDSENSFTKLSDTCVRMKSHNYTPEVWAAQVYKAPTGDTVEPGGWASFVVSGGYVQDYQWCIRTPDKQHWFTLDEAKSEATAANGAHVPKDFLQVTWSGEDTDRLILSNIPADLDGYYIFCRLSSYDQISWTFTGDAKITVIQPSPSPTSQSTGDPAAGSFQASPDGLSWKLEDGTLTIAGKGAMADYSDPSAADGQTAPWAGSSGEITCLVIEEGVTSVGAWAFYRCENLTTVLLPKGLATVGEAAFFNCDSLTELTFSKGLTRVAKAAFYDCDALTAVEFPEGFSTIGENAFTHCGSLESVKLPESLTAVGQGAFSQCGSLAVVSYAGMRSRWKNVTVGRNNEPFLKAELRFGVS